LSAYYGPVQVLDRLTLTAAPGSVTALLGANGAGKTTLLRALSGLVRTAGEIWFEGARIDTWSADAIARAGMAHVPQGRGTFPSLSVEENLRVAGLARRVGAASRIDRVYQYFPRLRERRRQPAGQLSGGEQQMLAVGRALMLPPRLLLLDEPSFGLAPRMVDQLFDVLAAITRDERVTTIVVEQNVERALALAERAWLLETGRVVFAGGAEDVRHDAALRRAYLGA
jgi:branched-chain amino acid transport system ATP-binding protein